MNRKDWWSDILLIVLIVMLVLEIFAMTGKYLRRDAGDVYAEKVMQTAQAGIDTYNASLPARPRTAHYSEAVTVKAHETVPEPEPDETPAVPDWYIESIPLSYELQQVVFDAACENGVDYFLTLGLIQVESEFDADAVSSCGCYGLCQLNPEWFPSGLSPEENVRAGMEYLGELLDTYQGDTEAALRAYNNGYDDGDRVYSTEVLSVAEGIMRDAGVVVP